MAKIFDRLVIEINRPINKILRAVQQDTNSRFLDVILLNNGVPIDLSKSSVKLAILDQNQKTQFENGELTDPKNGRCQFEIKSSITNHSGVVKLQISIFGDSNSVLTTEIFEMFVSSMLRDDYSIETSNEFGAVVVLFSVFQDITNLVKEIRDNIGNSTGQYDTIWKILEKIEKDLARGSVGDVLGKIGMDSDTGGTTIFGKLNRIVKTSEATGEKEFTQDGVFTVPEGVKKIIITACAGGGAGGDTQSDTSYPGGSGGDFMYKQPFNVNAQTNINITVGKGGTNTTKNGTDTIIGNLATLKGGKYAGGKNEIPNNKKVCNGGIGSKKYTQEASGDTLRTILFSNTFVANGGISNTNGGGGGASLGKGGDAQTELHAKAQNGYLGGGGGGATFASGTSDAGNGGDGYVLIEW